MDENNLSIISESLDARMLRDKPLQPGFDLNQEIDQLQRTYIRRALQQGQNHKQTAAELLGFRSYQALDSRMKSLGMKTNRRMPGRDPTIKKDSSAD